MKNKIERIYIKQWLGFKPYDKQTATDFYYLNLCNEVKKAIINCKSSLIFQLYIDRPIIDELSCFLTSYFEDLISETNIWNTFIKINKRTSSKQLPFYASEEYLEKEINEADVCFLIWYFLNTIQTETFISPINEFLDKIAKMVMEVFENNWEYAPENEFLKTFYSIDEGEEDYYNARHLIDTLLFKTYLFYPDSGLDLLDSEFDILDENENDENLLHFLRDNRDHKIHNVHTKLLGLKGQEWVAEILGTGHNLSKEFFNISKKINGFFLYKGQDEEIIFIEHIASSRKFNLVKKSFDGFASLKEIDTIIFLGIVMWKNEWWFSGISYQIPFEANLVLDEKNSFTSRNAVSFLDYGQKDMIEIMAKQQRAFKDFCEDQQIAFMSTNNLESFISNYMEHYRSSLKLSAKQIEDAEKRARSDGFFGSKLDEAIFSNTNTNDNVLVFFNPISGIEIVHSLNSAFPTQSNPFYNEEDSKEHLLALIFSDEISPELVLFCIQNFTHKFFETNEGVLYLDNLDFLMRFFKKGNYFTEPKVTFTGE